MRRALGLPLLILIGGLVDGPPATGQDAVSPKATIPSAKLLDDVESLRRIYEAAHPGLYRYNTKAQLDGHFARLRAEFARDRTLAEAYIAFSQFLGEIRCGHTYANFFNQPKEVVRALVAGKDRLPFYFRWIEGRMIVTRDLSPEPGIKPGSEILAINGVRTSDILAKLLTIARADGSNDAKRVAYLEVQGEGKYEAFDLFWPLFFPPGGGRIKLLVRATPSSDPAEVLVEAQDMGRRKLSAGVKEEAKPGESDPPWRFETLGDRASYLRMPSWALYNSRWDWRSLLDRGFDDLIGRNVPALILDLRGNEGGLDVGNAILARITPGPIRVDRSRRYTRYRTWPLPPSFDALLDTWDWSFKDWGLAAKEDRDGFFRMTKFDDDAKGDVIAPRGRRYPGRIVVLIDASNSSATFQFAQIVKETKLATLVGQTTGGNLRGINGGAFFFVTLPNSKIEVDLPLVATFHGGPPWPAGEVVPFREIPDAGIEPDLRVTPSIEAIAKGIDAELQAAKVLVEAPK